MDSLRSRPSQAPRAQRSPTKLSKSTTRGKSTRVDDKIKKRMSMRYAEISSPIDSNGIPAMPTFMPFMPDGGGDSAISYGTDDAVARERDAARVAQEDKRILSSEDFDPDAFLKSKLANSTEAELRSLQSSLERARNDTASDLQRSVFKNYAEFVLISKEISVLENEMLELKELVSDYKSMPQMLHIPDPTSVSSANLSTYKRSSVADLRILYFNQMQALHASIEGASKFVPTTPGRHVIGEFENIMSLNAATYKISHKVKMVVLDDALLIAKRRRRNAGGDGTGSTVNEGKLVAEKCWSINDITVLDTKDSSSMTNVFKVKTGKETHVYRTENTQEKQKLLTLFRQVHDELISKKRKEREGEHERRKTLFQSGGRNSQVPALPEWMADLALKGGDVPNVASDAKGKAERDARWVGDWSDELTVAIALKQWNKAVQLVEDGQAKVATMPPLAARLPPLIVQLTASLLESLALPSNRKSSTVNLISLLNRLKAGSAARNAFLEMRGKVVQNLMRKIPFEGHVPTYIGELAVVFFTGIKHTADWYLASFKENDATSSFITWAKQQIEKYAQIFRKQVWTKDVEDDVVSESVQVTLTQSRKLLVEYGIDFRFLLQNLLVETPSRAVDDNAKFVVDQNRQSKRIVEATLAKSTSRNDLRPSKPSTHLNAPPPITISDAPPGRRRSPAPPNDAAKTSSSSPPLPRLNTSSYQSLNSAGLKGTSSELHSAASSTFSGLPVPQDTSGRVTPSRPSGVYRSRTPVSAAQASVYGTPPGSSFTSPPSPQASRRGSPPPPPSSASVRPTNSTSSFNYNGRDWDRPPRSQRASPVPRLGTASPAPVPVPPRSIHRPGSAIGTPGRPPPVPREGMF